MRKQVDQSTVLIVLASPNVGGLERRFIQLVRFLEERCLSDSPRFDVLVTKSLALKLSDLVGGIGTYTNLTFTAYGPSPRRIDGPQPLIRRVLGHSHLSLLLLSRMRKRYAAAHFVDGTARRFVRLVRSARRVTSFVDSTIDPGLAATTKIRRAVGQGFVFDCLSDSLADYLRHSAELPASRIYTAPCSFIDYRTTFVGVKEEVLTFASRLVPGKGLELLLDCLEPLLDEFPRLRVNILGAGPLRASAVRQVQSLQAGDRVHVGYAHRLSSRLSTSLIFVSLQEKENYPSQSLLEAMACGNAIVATDVGLTRRLVASDCGIRISPFKEDLLAAVRGLLLDPDKAAEMGARARAKVMAEHTAERFVSYLSGVYAGHQETCQPQPPQRQFDHRVVSPLGTGPSER